MKLAPPMPPGALPGGGRVCEDASPCRPREDTARAQGK